MSRGRLHLSCWAPREDEVKSVALYVMKSRSMRRLALLVTYWVCEAGRADGTSSADKT